MMTLTMPRWYEPGDLVRHLDDNCTGIVMSVSRHQDARAFGDLRRRRIITVAWNDGSVDDHISDQITHI